jgi:hypothetical protein
MPDAIFVGYVDRGWGVITEPIVAFKTVEAATKWKFEQADREFKLVELK